MDAVSVNFDQLSMLNKLIDLKVLKIPNCSKCGKKMNITKRSKAIDNYVFECLCKQSTIISDCWAVSIVFHVHMRAREALTLFDKNAMPNQFN